MLSSPDIVVVNPESSEVLLAVQVKGIAARASADGLKGYMLRQNCPAGMLVNPETIFFLTNLYTAFQPSSIEQTGSCAASELLLQTDRRRHVVARHTGCRAPDVVATVRTRIASGVAEWRKTAAARQLNKCA